MIVVHRCGVCAAPASQNESEEAEDRIKDSFLESKPSHTYITRPSNESVLLKSNCPAGGGWDANNDLLPAVYTPESTHLKRF